MVVHCAARAREASNCYVPLPGADLFHRSQASERLLIGSNRAGKTLAAVRDFAWSVTGTHPYRTGPRENGRFYAVGLEFDHVRDVMWNKLARPGAFKIIRDEITGNWRPVLPDLPFDAANREKWREAGPLLPDRWIAKGGVSWNSKNEDIPEIVRLVNGTTINWYSSRGIPQRGTSIDGWWFDEEIENQRFLPECEARCIDRGGGGFWSCTPENSTRQLYEMYQRATAPGAHYDVAAFKLSIQDNPHISQRSKARFRSQLRTEHEVKTKWHGEFVLSGLLVYPEYHRDTHFIRSFDIPAEWSRYLVVDPGVQVCAVLFCAVPPPDSPMSEERHIYDELYIQRCSASIFADCVSKRMGHLRDGGFEAFVIDHRMGRQTQVAAGRTVEDQYSEALQQKGVWSRSTHTDFFPGNHDIAAREESMRRWLETNPGTGKPTLQIHDRCASLDWEMTQQFYKKSPEGPPTNKREGINDHAVSCAEYFADFDPRWVRPPRTSPANPIADMVARNKRARNKNKDYVALGPPSHEEN